MALDLSAEAARDWSPKPDDTTACVWREARLSVITSECVSSRVLRSASVEMIALFPDDPPGQGSYLVYVDRSLFDGELGRFKRRMLVSGVLSNVESRLEAVRDHFVAR